MRSGRGFTLIELMVVILVISILVAVTIPILRGQVSAGKWAEGKTMMGDIATAIRSYCAVSSGSTSTPTNLWVGEPNSLGFLRGDLAGAYFDGNDFSFSVTQVVPLEFTVTAGPKLDLVPTQYQLDQSGRWTTP
jgi:prepilin-type N-terminal cleavage/methylation domain-containing protein